jgi:hypothetical protein
MERSSQSPLRIGLGNEGDKRVARVGSEPIGELY